MRVSPGVRVRRRRRLRRGARGQEPEWIDVTLLVARNAHPHVHVGLVELRLARRADGADRVALRDCLALLRAERPQVDECDGVAAAGLDRERQPVGRERARVRDLARHGCAHRFARGARNVDASADAAGVWVRAVEAERGQHGAVDRPRPRMRARDAHGQCQEYEQQESPHRITAFVVQFDNRAVTVAAASSVVKLAYSELR
jgi:hypothetical protein